MRSRTIALVVGAVGLAIGGVVVWNALSGDGSETVLVSAEDRSDPGNGERTADPEGEQPEGSGSDERSGHAEQDEWLGTSGNSSADRELAEPPESGTDGSADPDLDEPSEPQQPTPEELSTGPVLEWAEYEPGIAGLSILQSVGDGRVLAWAWPFAGAWGYGAVPDQVIEQVFVTGNGVDWTEVPMPDGVTPDQVDLSSERWLVAGLDRDPGLLGYGPFGPTSSRVFFSDDEGTTWTELHIDMAADPAPSSRWLVQHSLVMAALVSDTRIVLGVISFETLDAGALLKDRGLLPESSHLAVWGDIAGDKAVFTLFDPPDPDDPWAVDPAADEETLEVSIEELGLTAEERAALGGVESSRISILSSDGSTVELTAQHDGNAVTGFATGSGFELTIFGERDLLVLTSADGLSWSERQSSWEDHSSSTAVSGDTVWRIVSSRSDGFSVLRGDDGQTSATVATFEGLGPAGDPVAGPAGVAVPAFVVDSDVSSGSDIVMPEGRVAKDGYELRYNEPEGGLTLWDLAADAPVYEFGPETVASDTVPDGVRQIDDDGSFAVVFEDPETGVDLVTFTDDDLSPILDAPVPDDMYEPPEQWVGWSADGDLWGWQTVAGAFGIDEDEGEPWVQLAVGGDFVIAQVQTFPRPEPSEAASGQNGVLTASSSEPLPPRWFIARVP
ncbi:MAG: hypothetical protein F4Y12_06555 [Acidimicrobiaceae bacterium]|nr:hypothetical protein [Acidimicrobiaceae bacterium]